MNWFKSLFIVCLGTLIACNHEPLESMEDPSNIDEPTDSLCINKAVERGIVRIEGAEIWLRGSNDGNTSFDFNITDWDLDACELKFGLGRESFPALNNPEYVPIQKVEDQYRDEDKFIMIKFQDGIKAYPYDLMITHEVVNDLIDGEPVMIAYCVLADLGAVYTRKFCDSTLTFALSGYTYSNNQVWDGTDAFVLWDRETESLWWPLVDKAVSGLMRGEELLKYDGQWTILTFSQLKLRKDRIWVLKAGQEHAIDPTIPTYEKVCN